LLDQKTPGNDQKENQQTHDEVLPGKGTLPVDGDLPIFRKKMVEGINFTNSI
jgi:hypothetical protein